MPRKAVFGQPLEVMYFPLASGWDALALSRFVHHVVDMDLCTAIAVIVELKGDCVANRGIVGVLNMAIGRLARKHVRAVVLSPSRATLEQLDRATFPNIGLACLVESEAEAALLLLDNAWRSE